MLNLFSKWIKQSFGTKSVFSKIKNNEKIIIIQIFDSNIFVSLIIKTSNINHIKSIFN